MSLHLISIGLLAAIFLLGALRKVNFGALALVAAFVVGTCVFGQSTSEVLKGFPANLFVILVGVTCLFAIARSNGTVDWLVNWFVPALRGHVAALPSVMFVRNGALSPAAVAKTERSP